MGRRRPQSDSSSGGSWMDTYGDLVTLLLTFFVLLYSFSSIDAAKWEALVKSLARNGRSTSTNTGTMTGAKGDGTDPELEQIEVDETDFEAAPVESPANQTPTGSMAGALPTVAPTPSATTTALPVTPTPRATPKPSSTVKPTVNSAMNSFYRDMQSHLSSTPLAGSASLEQKGSQLLIRLRVSLIFEPGSDKLKPEAQQLLSEAAEIIKRNLPLVKSLRTEGHTDSVTPPAGNIESKWELAALRAARVLQQIANRTGINQGKIYTVGYGSARPVASNSTAEGRNLNNRVDIIIVN